VKKVKKVKRVNKAAEIRTLLAEGVDVGTISKKLHIPKPYVIQVRWHWKKAGSPPPKKAKPQPKKLFIQPQHLDKALKLLGSEPKKSPREIWDAREKQLTEEMEARQKVDVTETFSGLFGAALPKLQGEPAKFDWSAFEETREDPVNHPSHYMAGGIETIDFIEAKKLNYRLGNVVKYVSRCGLKSDNPLEDLRKARWYLDREIENLSGW